MEKKQVKSKSKSTTYKRRKTKKPFLQSLSLWVGVILVLTFCYVLTLSLLSERFDSPVEVAQVPQSELFIDEIAPHAKVIQERHNILPSIILGQAILESDWGQSQLAATYGNLFGIKAYGDGDKVNLGTSEFVNGKWIEIKADFRVYPNWQASMDDHALLFVNGVDWNPNLYHGVIEATTYQEAAQALQEAGYATDPDYRQKIVGVIETYGLNQYD